MLKRCTCLFGFKYKLKLERALLFALNFFLKFQVLSLNTLKYSKNCPKNLNLSCELFQNGDHSPCSKSVDSLNVGNCKIFSKHRWINFEVLNVRRIQTFCWNHPYQISSSRTGVIKFQVRLISKQP